MIRRAVRSFSMEHRGDGIYPVARKVGPAKDRYPAWDDLEPQMNADER
jgi:hypothetical protein